MAMQRLSPAVVSSLIERGSAHHVTWAIDYATTVLAAGENNAVTLTS